MAALTRQARLLAPALVLLAGSIAALPSRGASPDDGGGARRMAELLQQIAARSDPSKSIFQNAARAERLEREVAAPGAGARPWLLRDLAEELLNAGRTGDAIARLDQLEAMMRSAGIGRGTPTWVDLRVRQAIANLRRGEDDNCILHHDAKSCIFPIAGSGLHGERRGSRAAAAILTELLEQDPADLRARWFLNLAFMTLGEYPEKVPQQWLLEPKLFASEHDIKPFPDVAGTVGLDANDLAGGSILEDFDGDGNLDVMASAMGLRSPLRYFRNQGDGSFSERTEAAGLTGEVGGLNILQADYDNDGWADVLVLRGAWMGSQGRYPNSLLRNQGDGTFADVTKEAGLLSFHPTQTAVWGDFDGDGWLDLFIGNETTDAGPEPSELYRNNRDGTFTECAAATGTAVTAFVKGVTSGDFDNDGRLDLYVSIWGAPNRLYHNDGPAAAAPGQAGGACALRFTDVAAAAGVTEPKHSFPTWFWDYDNDGWEDIFVSGYLVKDLGDIAADYLGRPHQAELPRLYRNNGNGTFSDVTRATRLDRVLLSMGSNYGDLDSDGWLDFYVGTGNPGMGTLLPNRAFRNSEGRLFQDVTTSGGLGHLQKGHGVSFGDIDNDGDQDIHHVLGGAFEGDRFPNALFENPGHGSHWVGLKLDGVRSNRAGVGARIKVVVRTPRGERTIHRTVRTGGSFGASPLRQEIGLGDAERIERVEILWPSGGSPHVLHGLAMDRLYVVREGEPGPTQLALRPFRLGSPPATRSSGK